MDPNIAQMIVKSRPIFVNVSDSAFPLMARCVTLNQFHINMYQAFVSVNWF